MAGHLLNVFLHIMLSIVWVGYALFWAIVAGQVVKEYGPEGSPRVFALVNRAPWPPRKLPIPWHMKFSGVAAGLLLLLALTGAILAAHEAGSLGALASGAFLSGKFGRLLAAKVILVAVLVAGQVRLARSPGPRLAWANLAVTVAVVVLSALLARSVET
jgi:hypothetical protein